MYNIKVYNSDLVYKKTINPLTLKNEISYTENVNAGQGECIIRIETDFGDDSIVFGDVVRVYKNLDLLYTGVVGDIERRISSSFEE